MKRLALLTIILAVLVGGCSEKKSSPTAPGPVSTCTITVQETPQNFPFTGGSSNFAVTTQAGCNWTVGGPSWVTVTSGTSGTGNGTVNYTVTPNTGPARSGFITVSDKSVKVSQDVCVACVFTLNLTSKNFSNAGGDGSFSVTVTGGCDWRPVPNVGWIRITSSQACTTCNGTVTFSVDRNLDGQRTGHIPIGDMTFTVTQDAVTPPPAPAPAPTPPAPAPPPPPPPPAPTPTPPAPAPVPCTLSEVPSSMTVLAEAGGSGFSVKTQAGCQWFATTSTPWITLTVASGVNSGGGVQFNRTANTGSARSGTITVTLPSSGATATIVVNQSATSPPPPPPPPSTCTFTIQEAVYVPAPSAGTGFSVETQAGCQWSATTSTPWITLTVASGVGSGGGVQFTTQTNSGSARSGLITIAVANKVVTIVQSGQ